MSAKKYELDMTKGSILKNILSFTIPLILTSLLQLLYNAADLVVVSRFAGSDAMASVGATSSISSLFVNFSVGLALGASVAVARSFGARDNVKISKAVHTSVLLSVIVGIITAALGIAFSRPLLSLMGTPEDKVLEGAVLYMRIYFIGIPASLVYNFSASILRAVGDTKRPLYILSTAGIVNVILNLIFVIVFHMGVAGVAIATAVSNAISMVAVLAVLVRSEGPYRLFISKIKLWKEELGVILKVGVPSGIQSCFFALSNSLIQSAVNSFGAAAIAGNAAGVNIEGFVYASMNAYHQTTVTAVSQNYGAGKKERITKTIWTSLLCVTITGAVLGALSVIFADSLLGIYITDSLEALRYGKIRIIITGAPYFLCGIMDVLAGALRGFGASTVAMVNSFFGACVFRVLWVLFLLPIYHYFGMIFLGQSASWIVVIAMHLIAYGFVKKRAFKKLNDEAIKAE